METYCVSCKKNTRNENSSVKTAKEDRFILVTNCYKFLSTEDKFMSQLYLWQQGFT